MVMPRRDVVTPRKQSSDDVPTRRPRAESLNPETRHGIVVVVLFTLAAIVLLSLFDLAGPLGQEVDRALRLGFGGLRYLVPIVLIGFGYLLLVPKTMPLSASTYVGLALLTLSGTSLMHFGVEQSAAVSAALDGRGGGVVGLVLSYPLRAVTGGIGAVVIVLATLVISLLVTFNTTLRQLAGQGSFVGSWYATVRSWWYRIRYRLESRRQVVESETGDDESVDETDEAAEFTSREVAAPAVLDPNASDQAELFPAAVAKRTRRKLDVPLDLLNHSTTKPTSARVEEKKELIRKTLETFGISVEMQAVNIGPTVTQFTLKPNEGVKLAQITTLQNDLALALAAHPIRIEAPIPGMSLVGIEVPNESVAIVNLREILESDGFRKRKSNLTFALGKDVAGKPWATNLDPMPHLLIAGATGSGKSVMINSLIVSLLYANSPDDLKLILVDPKRVEFSLYNDVPHLLTPVITDTQKTVNALRWIVGEMDRRFQVLSNAGKRNIQSYNEENGHDMPYLVLIIDELADLMSVAAQEVEGAIIRLAQMARAVGIHLVLATQRPSVNVITGLIKANITARIAFNVASAVDSRTILDIAGAEKLLGKGDMLFVSSELSKPKRLQAAYVSDAETQRVAEYLKGQAAPDYVTEVTEKRGQPVGSGVDGQFDDLGDDELLGEAKELILRSGKASASFLQRRLRVGYARAARILDLLEERGIIGPGEGAKPREILMSRDGYEGLDDEPAETTGEMTSTAEDVPSDRAAEDELTDRSA